VFRRHEESGALATLRDLVEIVAIVAAGIWAIYVFAYEQRIKPAQQPPSLLLSGSLHRAGERNGLVQLGFNGTARNTGQGDVSLVALGFAASGIRYTSKGTPFSSRAFSGSTLYQRDARVASRVSVYRQIELTRFVDKWYGGGITISPGEEVPYSGIFLVKAAEFDSIVLYGSIAYAKVGISGGYPTAVTTAPNGAVSFETSNANPNYYALEVTLDQISLW
jgi:hypothetical protein